MFLAILFITMVIIHNQKMKPSKYSSMNDGTKCVVAISYNVVHPYHKNTIDTCCSLNKALHRVNHHNFPHTVDFI